MDRTPLHLTKLPEVAYIDNSGADGQGRPVPDTSAKVLKVTRGMSGYHLIFTHRSADELNAESGVTPAQREALFAGSCFGFHVPAADVDNYDAQGNLLGDLSTRAYLLH